MKIIDKIKEKRIAKKKKCEAELIDFIKTASDVQFIRCVNMALDKRALRTHTVEYDTVVDVLIQKMHPITEKDIIVANDIATSTRNDLIIKEKPEWHIESKDHDKFILYLIESSFDNVGFAIIAHRLASMSLITRGRFCERVKELFFENIQHHTPNNKGHNVSR